MIDNIWVIFFCCEGGAINKEAMDVVVSLASHISITLTTLSLVQFLNKGMNALFVTSCAAMFCHFKSCYDVYRVYLLCLLVFSSLSLSH